MVPHANHGPTSNDRLHVTWQLWDGERGLSNANPWGLMNGEYAGKIVPWDYAVLAAVGL